MWTRSCFSISCVLSFLYSQKYFQKVWTGGQFRKIIIKMNNVFYYYKVRTCEQEAVFVFHVFFLSCILQNIFKKCGQVDKFWKFWKKKQFSPNVFHYHKVWTCGEETVSLFSIFFILFTFQNIFKKCGQVDKKLYFYFMFSFFLVPSKLFSKSVDGWTSSESSEKNNFHLMYFIIIKCGYVDLWRRNCISISIFFIFLFTFQIIFKKCGQVDKLWKFLFSFKLMYFIIKCVLVDKMLSFYIMFYFFLLPSKIFSKSVDWWTSSHLPDQQLRISILESLASNRPDFVSH